MPLMVERKGTIFLISLGIFALFLLADEFQVLLFYFLRESL